MTPEERAEREADADRCRRRGELGHALALYQEIAAVCPDDTALAEKIALLTTTLQPLELQHPKANLTEARATPVTLEQQAEQHAARGDYAGAMALYRRALRDRPGNELLKERLGQLFALVQQNEPPGTAPEEHLRALLDRIQSRRRRAGL